MKRRTPRAIYLVLFVVGLAGFVLVQPAGVARAEPATPNDAPTPVVSDIAEEWGIGGGLLYWADSCFAEEQPPPSIIKRRPVAGGTTNTLEQTDPGNCLTYLNLAAADDGVYYYDAIAARLEYIPLSEPYTPLVVADLPASQKPNDGSTLELAGAYVYWVSSSAGAVLRAPKVGGAVEVVASSLSNPIDVMVLGNIVYWTDSAGVWTILNDCGTLPCENTKQPFAAFGANTTGSGLLYRSGPKLGAFSYSILWVERTATGADSNYRIRSRACSFVMPCTDPATFYDAATNWVIGRPVTDNTNVFWTERFVSIATPDGKIRRKPFGGDAADIAVSLPTIERRLAIANGNLYFAVGSSSQPNGAGIYLLPLNASAILRDLAASAWEVTQGIQNTANGAPLVADKTTYVRVYASELSGPNALIVEATLQGTRNGVPLPGSPLSPLNGARSLRTGAAYDRARLDDGWLFLLPASWAQGAVALHAAVDPRHAYTDPNLANNVLDTTVNFQKQPPVCVWAVPVRTHTPRPSTTDPNFWAMVDRFKARWPVPDVWIYRDTDPVEELQVCWAAVFPYPCYGPYELEDGWALDNGIPDRDKVIVSLWTRAQLSFNPDACDDIGAPVHFMGMVHPDANNGGASGYASLYSNQSWVQLPDHTPNPAPIDWFAVRAGSVMAQELGHNYGRKHVDCGNPDDTDGSYPYPPCQISDAGQDKYYGFDGRTRIPIAPTAAADFMSYNNRTWVSDYTWRALFNSFAAMDAPAFDPTLVNAGEVVYAAGYIDMAINQGKLNRLLVLPPASVPPQTLAGAMHPANVDDGDEPLATYRLRLLDAANAVLHEEVLTPVLMDDHSATSNPALFSTTFVAPAGTVARVQLLADAAVIETLKVGSGKPTVTVQKPVSSEAVDAGHTVAWTAHDPHPADALRFTVQYSYDNGGHWHTLATDLAGAPDGKNSYAIADLGSLHGSNGNSARMRILASDGYNTGIGLSAPFTVANRKPDVAILAPVAGQSIPAAIPVLLSGAATDAEDGGLGDTALTWKIDGESVGAGRDLAVAGLAPGAHAAALTATDSAGNARAVSAGFQIAPLSIPQTAAPLLDGFCDDDAYAAGTDVALAPYGEGAQAHVRIVRAGSALWACFSGMELGAASPGAFAGLRIDVDNSRNANAQPTDYGFFAGEDGDVFTVAGDGSGGFAASGPGGLSAQVSSGATGWAAELRIAADVIGGLDHMVGLRAEHAWVTFQGDDYAWPYASTFNQPNTWALAGLGEVPTLTSIDPVTATVNGAPFELVVEGTGFVSGTAVLWNGGALVTTFVDSGHLSATVDAGQLSNPAAVTINTRTPAPANFGSNGLPFAVVAPQPVITKLTPKIVAAGAPTTTITIDGVNFAADAQVLWDGTPLPTTFVNGSRVKVTAPRALLAIGGAVGITVRNQTPVEAISDHAPFTVVAASNAVFMPQMRR